MTIRPFETLSRLRSRMAEAIISQSGMRHPVLASHLRQSLAAESGPGALIPPPVLEGAFPFEPGDRTLGQLAGNVLDRRTVDALVGDDSGSGHSFPRGRKPYRHQLAAWKTLTAREPKSAVISAGTGSGKTECFLVPVLDSLYRRAADSAGVEAILLYPLNALIASQQERFDAWTRPAGGRIRYCLYKGDLPETLSADKRREALARDPQMVPDRVTLRESAPPLLVTNLTMLEYMLVRPQDAPILAQSRGKLKWIILDEAHTLVGAAAAEVALLLRRVMLAFDVDPATVRFVATSATIGEGPEVAEQLRQFLADIGGIDPRQVEVITGDRRLPQRPKTRGPRPDAAALKELAPPKLFDRLAGHDPVWDLVRRLKAETVPKTAFDQVGAGIGVDGEALAMALTRAQSTAGETLAPLRVHSFHRALPGLWSCTDPACPETPGNGWTAGRILHERVDACPACQMPVAELVTCNDCGSVFMLATETAGRLRPPRRLPPADEFQFEAEREIPQEEETTEDETDAPTTREREEPAPSIDYCISLSDDGKLLPLFVDRRTGQTADGGGESRYRLRFHIGGGKGPCPVCEAKAKTGDKLYPVRFGAPFILGNAAPLLLASMPPDPDVKIPDLPQMAPALPSSGRQLISFTDSRQGTARMAARLQIESERSFVRSFLYQAVQHAAAGGEGCNKQRIDNILQEIKDLKAIPNWRENSIASMVQEKEQDLARLTGSGPVSIPWAKLQGELADRTEVREWLASVWGDRADLFRNDGASPAAELARALLLRELMRRPRAANSVETMGLVRLVYPAIDRITAPPSGFLARKGTLDDWKAWLTCLVTFSIRNQLAVSVKRDLLHWIMRKGEPKHLAAAGADPGANQVRWPWAFAKTGRRPRVVELLRFGLGLNPAAAADREEINNWLTTARTQLSPLFPPNSSGEQALDFEKVEVSALKSAFVCPATRRIVDVAPFGLTPYARYPTDKAEPIEMPACPANGDTKTRRTFLETDPKVATLRARGLWTDLHDRIALFSPYARSAEHSAQLAPQRLRTYERAFKAGLINLLNCSTTMEMGVDIGSVNGVVMANVPPSIANYRQRVGRAGRRGQPLSLSFTFTRDRPLDIEAFRDPDSYLKRTIAAPKVALDSRPIVQRHVNAYLLARFISERAGDALAMKAGDFFGSPAEPGKKRPSRKTRPAAQFADWVALPTTAEDAGEAIARLVHGSVLEGRRDLAQICGAETSALDAEFEAEWASLQEQARDAAAIGASDAIKSQLKRLCGEFLLADLADRGFLPGHGFPNNVVTFALGRKEAEESASEQPGLRHGGPKRPLDIAIRDYAPGSEVVVDGLVYRVGGVSLNWHRPSSEEGVREVQALRWAARCAACGDNWTGAGAWPESCRTCGASGDVLKVENYLKPAGFLRDRHELVHTEADQVTFIPAEAPRVSAGAAPWEALGDPRLGRMRINRRGTVYYHNRGPSGLGYGLCLHCGRMEPMQDGEQVCSGLADHKPLRARENWSLPCPGNDRTFALQSPLHLGHEVHTDVLELQPANRATPAAANALAIALREALARRLGIDADEMGYAVAPARNPLGAVTTSLFLHDRAAGGAGYVVRAVEGMRDLLKEARKILDCPHGCARACSACILVADAPDKEDDLDRKAALAFLAEHLALPDSLAPEDRFVADAELSERPLSEIDAGLHRAAGARLMLWTRAPDIIALDDWPATALFRRWTDNGSAVTLVLPEGTLDRLDGAQILHLRDYRARHGITLAEGEPAQFGNGAVLFALLEDGAARQGWASRDRAVLDVGPEWGSAHVRPLARGPVVQIPPVSPLAESRLVPPSHAAVVVLGAKLDGPISQFGARMSAEIRAAARRCGIPAKDGLVTASYQDRYARSPLVLRLLVDTIAALADGQPVTLEVETAPDRASGYARAQVGSDIADDTDLARMAESYGEQAGVSVQLRAAEPAHKRSLRLAFRSGGEVIADLDQGFGWLRYDGRDGLIGTGQDCQEATRRLASLSGKLSRRHGHDSQMVIWKRK